MNNQNNTKKNYYYSHSTFRRILDKVDEFMDRFMIMYWVSIAFVIFIPTIIIYLSLPEDIRTPLSGMVSGIITLILISITINHINQKSSERNTLYNYNYNLYNDLSKIIINLLSEINHTEKIDNSRLNSYIVENYSKMCLTFEPSLIWDISTLNEECKLSKENTVYYCEKILKRIRKEIGINQTFHINKKAISYISNSYKEVAE